VCAIPKERQPVRARAREGEPVRTVDREWKSVRAVVEESKSMRARGRRSLESEQSLRTFQIVLRDRP
jgi:hypothetical protein